MTINKSSDAYHKLMNLFERYCYQDPNVNKTRVINKSTFSKSTLKESDILMRHKSMKWLNPLKMEEISTEIQVYWNWENFYTSLWND